MNGQNRPCLGYFWMAICCGFWRSVVPQKMKIITVKDLSVTWEVQCTVGPDEVITSLVTFWYILWISHQETTFMTVFDFAHQWLVKSRTSQRGFESETTIHFDSFVPFETQYAYIGLEVVPFESRSEQSYKISAFKEYQRVPESTWVGVTLKRRLQKWVWHRK